MDGLRPHIAVRINGHDTSLLVDTGAFFSMLSDDAAARFAMKSAPVPYGMEISGVGGATRDARAVSADTFSFTTATFKNIPFLVGGRVGEGDAVGVIGENAMGPFDVEYDFANGVMRWFKAVGCGDANLAYWAAGMSPSRISLDAPGRYLEQVNSIAYVDGHRIHVTFDSGADLSVLNRPAAERAGVQMSSDSVTSGGISHGIYGGGQEQFLAPFASFKIGDEEIKNTRLRVSSLRLGDTEMLLGADFFLSHRILVSNSQKKLYFTYNGGSVFRLDATATTQRADGGPAPSSPGTATPELTSVASAKTAAEFQRRGQASAARQEFSAAIADFTRAIEIEPTEGTHYHSRAMARLSNGQPVLAMADLDQALKYKPDDVPALVARGQHYVATRDLVRARADFEAAMKLSPDNTDLPVEIGLAYAEGGAFDTAIQQFDAWVSAHPKAADLAQVLSMRCWTRAVWGKELEKALADCDTALRGERVSAVMENRGLVLLRMGRVDEAIKQYDAAIRAQPKAAWALYGRGLSELKKGKKAEGDADIKAATAIAPDLPREAKRYGLVADDAPAAAKS
ncbi:MAG TPA: aspartyl protease family protein [Phenylobacterium sp.]|nr:aspartyl protease family protein [Phenylobacterium sp.]